MKIAALLLGRSRRCGGPAGMPAALMPAGLIVASTPTVRPKVGRIAVIVLENRSYEQIIGNPSAPLHQLARQAAARWRPGYYAITHPSLPNYHRD